MMAARPAAPLLSEVQQQELGRAVADLAGGNAALRAALLDSLIESIGADIATMRLACQAGDWRRLRTAVHRLKGGGGIVRCGALVECCRQLEAEADAANAQAVAHLTSDCTQLGEALTHALLALHQDRQGI